MALVFGERRVNLTRTGTTATVPDSPKARLMYYFNCVCTVLQMDNNAETRRLRDYDNYYLLTESETDKLLVLCLLLSPDELIGKCFFPGDALCGYSSNEFYNLSAVQSRFVVTEHVLVGGQTRQVNKIMVFKMSWMEQNYIKPIKSFSQRLNRIGRQLRGEPAPRAITYPSSPTYRSYNRQYSSDSCCCTIL